MCKSIDSKVLRNIWFKSAIFSELTVKSKKNRKKNFFFQNFYKKFTFLRVQCPWNMRFECGPHPYSAGTVRAPVQCGFLVTLFNNIYLYNSEILVWYFVFKKITGCGVTHAWGMRIENCNNNICNNPPPLSTKTCNWFFISMASNIFNWSEKINLINFVQVWH